MTNTYHPLKMVKMAAICISLSGLFVSAVAQANFMVYPMSATVAAKQNTLIRVYSKSKETQYIKVSVKKVINPGTPQEKDEPVANWQENNLIISPNKIIVPAGSNKAVRLTQITPPAQETLYRVYFEAVSPDAPSPQDMMSADGKKKTAVSLSLNMVFAALVRVMPEKSVTQLSASLQQNNLTVHNTGNIRTGVMSVDFCPSNTKTDACQHQDFKRYIYPEQSVTAEIKSKSTSPWVLINIKKDDNSTDTETIPYHL